MNESQTKRRTWIKNIIIIVLVVLLVLTMCSNTILNFSLPEVAVQYPQYATIASRIRTSATVEANQSYSVTIAQTRVVSAVEVRTGQTVQKGDVIFRLEEGDSTEIDAAKSELQQLNISLIQKLKADPSASSGQSSTTVKELENQLEEAKTELAYREKELEKIKEQQGKIPTYSELMDAENLLTQIDETIDYLEDEIKRLQGKQGQIGGDGYFTPEEIETLIAQAQEKVDEMNYYYTQALLSYEAITKQVQQLETQLEQATTAYKNAQKAVTDYQTQNPTTGSVTMESLLSEARELETKKQAIAEAKQYFSENEYNTARQNYLAAKEEYDTRYATATAEELAALKAALTAAENIYKPLETQYKDIQSLEQAYNLAYQTYQKNYFTYLQSSQQSSVLTSLQAEESAAKTKMENADTSLTAAKKELETKETAFTEAETAKKTAESELETATGYREYDTLGDQIKQLQNQLTEMKVDKTEAEAIIDSASDDSKEKLEETLRDKQKLVSDQQSTVNNLIDKVAAAKVQAEQDEQNAKLDQQQYEIELQQIKDKITAKEAEIARLEEYKTDGTVTAPVSGVIESLAVSVGQKAEANTPIATIVLSEMGYTMKCTVTSEQAAKVSVGDTATLQWYYWGEEPTVRVSSIKADASSQGKNKIITLDVTGDVTPGTTLTFTLGSKNTSYDCVIPKNAVREDKDGSFVLIVTAKSTPLGNRYTAKRVAVEVLASDETNAAVSGSLSGEYVITTANDPISDGMQVRLSDNT